jgi:hypothetical protein
MRFASAARTPAARAVLAGTIAFALAALAAHGRSSPYDNYVLLARAFLAGHIAIDWPGAYIDALPFGGAYYVIEAPFPALLLLPFVAAFHDANQTLLALVLCGIAIGCCWLTCEQLGVRRGATVGICAFALAGTTLWWCAMLGDVWFLAHVASVACTFVALAEVTGKRRGWLVALAALAALFSRFSLVLAIPVYAWLVLRDRDARAVRGAATGFAVVLAAGAALWVAYNLARWGVWYDIGYTAWYHQDSAGEPTGSPFQVKYLPYQLWSFFVQAPAIRTTWPWLIPGYGGVALTWTSPALAIAFFARRPRGLVVALWIAAALVAGPSFVYYVNGYAQFGMRHSLDFAPFLIVLMALALREGVPAIARVAIAYSCVAGAWGVWFWNTFYRQT